MVTDMLTDVPIEEMDKEFGYRDAEDVLKEYWDHEL